VWCGKLVCFEQHMGAVAFWEGRSNCVPVSAPNENTNGLLRQYFPKHHDFATTTPETIAEVQKKLNNRLRKCLAYRTPAEVFTPSPRRLLRLES